MSEQAMRMVGTNNNQERAKDDFYKTPPKATKALLKKEDFEGDIWEPACGDGAISKVLEEYGYDVLSTDLVDRGYGQGGKDFLKDDLFSDSFKYDNIVTNPPFKKGLEFVKQAKRSACHKIAFLLKTLFLESKSRYEMFQDKEFPLKTVYQFSKRINPHKKGEEVSSGTMAFAWFVWDKSYSGKPQIEWIMTDD